MPCQKFSILNDQFPEMPTRYGNGDVAFCDQWMFEAVNHALVLRQQYQAVHGTPYPSNFANSDWDEVVTATRQMPIEIRIRLMLRNWPGALIWELEDLEKKVLH